MNYDYVFLFFFFLFLYILFLFFIFFYILFLFFLFFYILFLFFLNLNRFLNLDLERVDHRGRIRVRVVKDTLGPEFRAGVRRTWWRRVIVWDVQRVVPYTSTSKNYRCAVLLLDIARDGSVVPKIGLGKLARDPPGGTTQSNLSYLGL